MLVIRDRYLHLDTPLALWPRAAGEAYALLDRAPIVNVMQCSDAVKDMLAPLAFRIRPFHTLLVDLTRTEDEIFASFDKSCRRHLRKAEAIPHEIRCNEDLEGAYDLLDTFIRQNNFRAPLTRDEWDRVTEKADVFTVHYEDRIVACDVTLVEPPYRAHVIMGAMADRNDPALKDVIGHLNRAMNWHQIRYYKEKGLSVWDMGGIDPDPESPLYSITRYKRSFGGQEVKEYFLRLAANPVLRHTLRFAHDLRARIRP